MLERLQDYWLAACASEKLGARPLAVTVLGHPLVLARLGGRPIALEDRCPHRNAPLSAGSVRDDLLVCPYHGWSFDGEGTCRKVPGLCAPLPNAAVPCYGVREGDGIVWVSLREGALDPYRAPFAQGSFVWSVELPGTLLNVVENFLDATHTHFVHSGLIRSEGKRQKARVEIQAEGDRVEATYRDEGAPSGWMARLFEGRRTSSHGRFLLPSTAEIEYRSQRGTEFAMTAYVSPVSERLQRAQILLSTPQHAFPKWLRKAVLGPFLRAALRQDARILALQESNLERFGGENFRSTTLDLLRSHILRLLQAGPGPAVRREVEMEL